LIQIIGYVTVDDVEVIVNYENPRTRSQIVMCKDFRQGIKDKNLCCFRIEMEDWEHVTTCKNLMLSSQETHTGHKGFICVGTTHVYGEDITCRGRVSIIDR